MTRGRHGLTWLSEATLTELLDKPLCRLLQRGRRGEDYLSCSEQALQTSQDARDSHEEYLRPSGRNLKAGVSCRWRVDFKASVAINTQLHCDVRSHIRAILNSRDAKENYVHEETLPRKYPQNVSIRN